MPAPGSRTLTSIGNGFPLDSGLGMEKTKTALDAAEFRLVLVDKLTSDWAVYEGSTHVWFEMPIDS
jgi:hypothetical protein